MTGSISYQSSVGILNAAARRHEYRPDIDGLRAISILSVLAYHAFPALLPGGFVGVDIFFVISGYLITGIILDALQKGHFSYCVFYSRRIKRIFPALSVVLVACLVCGWLFLLPQEWRQLGKHIFGGAGFVSNLLFMREGGYFAAESASKPLLHLWSLGIEEQFYITWPAFLVLMWKRSDRILPVIIICGCVSFLANVAYIGRSQIAVFYFPFTRYWELLIGAFLAARRDLRPVGFSGRLPARLFERVASRKILCLVGVASLVAALSLAREDGHFPGYMALLPTCAGGCLIAAGPSAWFNRVVLCRRYMVFIGLISYPLYLWHWPVLVFSHLVGGGAIGWLAKALALLISLALSFWTYRLWESPIRDHGSSVAVTVSLACLVGVAGIAGLLIYGGAIATRLDTPGNQRVLAAIGDWDYPFGSNFQRGRGYEVGVVKGSSKEEVVLFGDSHMEQYYPRVKLLSLRGSGDFPTSVFITAGGCPPLPRVNPVSAGYACDSFFEFAMRYAQRPEVRAVVFGGYWELYFGHQYDRSPKERTSGVYRTGGVERDRLDVGMASTELVFGDFEKSMGMLIGQGKSVFVLLSNPTDEAYDPRRMISRLTNTVRFRNVDRDGYVEAVRSVVDRVRLAAESVGATVIDPVPYMCGGSVCPNTTSDGRPLYRDSNHLRASYAAEVAVFVDRVFQPSTTTAFGK